MSLFEASVHGLRARVRAIRTDIDYWSVRASETGDLHQHHSQVLRMGDYLHGTLSGAIAGKPIDPATPPPFAGDVDQLPALRRTIGSVHLMWEFFRDKLAQRDMDAFVTHLSAVDDLAWRCYAPFLSAAAYGPAATALDILKDPPLVFYSTDRAPFAQARSKTFHPMGLESRDVGDFSAELRRLPVPVIGVPWEVANRMPEAALVGHEAGHVIAEDLGLAAEALRALRAASFADQARAAVWQRWSDEVFADVIGVLATGTAFVDGLAAEMAGVRDEIRYAPIDADRPGHYPPPTLRIRLCESLLSLAGVTPSTAWSDTYDAVVGDSAEYVEDVEVVASALLDRGWECLGNRQLTDILRWTESDEDDARSLAVAALDGKSATESINVRIWVAAATHARRADPDKYAELDLDQRVAQHIVSQRTDDIPSARAFRHSILAVKKRIMPYEGHLNAELRDEDRHAGADAARRLGLV